jgi:2-methylisocitrate lyase-like PEP mutase family enzyme
MKTIVLFPFILLSIAIRVDAFTSSAQRLRHLIQTRGAGSASLLVPGIHDGLSAKIFAQSGAQVLFLSGFGVTASLLGKPDVGILTQTEMDTALRCVVQALQQMSPRPPIIVDGDTGFGGIDNIRRTVHQFASSGAAAITIEDQLFPKKCTYAAGEGVRVVERNECIRRVKVALAARDEAKEMDGNDILVVARTDCRAALGFEEAKARCLSFESLGADIVYAENLQSEEEYINLRNSLQQQTLTILAQVQTGDPSQRLYSVKEVGQMGYDMSLFGITALQAQVNALKLAAQMLCSSTNSACLARDSDITSFAEVKETIGFKDSEAFQSNFE